MKTIYALKNSKNQIFNTKALKYFIVSLVLITAFILLFLIYQQSINLSLSDLDSNLNIENIEEAHAAQYNTNGTQLSNNITLSTLTSTTRYSPYLQSANTNWEMYPNQLQTGALLNNGDKRTLYLYVTINLIFTGELLKAIQMGRVTMELDVKSRCFNWVGGQLGSSSMNQWLEVFGEKTRSITTDKEEDLSLKKEISISSVNLTEDTNGNYYYKKAIYFQSEVVIQGKAGRKVAEGSIHLKEISFTYTNTYSLPTVQYKTLPADITVNLENSNGLTGGKVNSITTQATITAPVVSGYYFSGWTGTEAIESDKKSRQFKTKAPIDISVSTNEWVFTANYTKITIANIASLTYTYSGATQGPNVALISGYNVTNKYGESSNSLNIESASSPYKDAGQYYFQSVILYDEKEVGRTEIIPFQIVKATPSFGDIKTLTLNYGQILSNKNDYFTLYYPTCNGGNVVGSSVWNSPTTLLNYGNTGSVQFTYTPDDNKNYEKLEVTIPANKIIVNKGNLAFNDDAFSNWTQINNLTYGESLNTILGMAKTSYIISNTYVTNGNPIVAGEWKLYKKGVNSDDPSYSTAYVPTVFDAGSSVYYYLEYIPGTNPTWYEPLINEVNIVVNKATPGIDLKDNEIVINDLVYGMKIIGTNLVTLGANYQDSEDNTIGAGSYYNANNVTLLQGKSIVPGMFVWFELNQTTPLTGLINASSKCEYTLRYIPTDLNNYEISYFGTKTFAVEKAAPVLKSGVNYITSNAITYGQSINAATFTNDISNKVYNQNIGFEENMSISGSWRWYQADMLKNGGDITSYMISNYEYPTVLDGTGDGYNGGKAWAVYFVPNDTTNYVSDPNLVGSLKTISYLKVNKANQNLYYYTIDGLTPYNNGYTAVAGSGSTPTEVIVKIYTTALNYVAGETTNPIDELYFKLNGNVVNVIESTIVKVNYSALNANKLTLLGSTGGVELTTATVLTELTVKLQVNRVGGANSDLLTGLVELYAYQSNNNNYNSVAEQKITEITFKRESIIAHSQTQMNYYSQGYYDFDANFASGNIVYTLTDESNSGYVSISDLDDGIKRIGFLKSGVVNLMLTCSDYDMDEDNGLGGTRLIQYFGVNIPITLYIDKTPVIVKFKDIEIVYGNRLEINYRGQPKTSFL